MKDKVKATLEYYQKLLDKVINILMLLVAGTVSSLLSYHSNPDYLRLLLTIAGTVLTFFFLYTAVKLHLRIKELISKL